MVLQHSSSSYKTADAADRMMQKHAFKQATFDATVSNVCTKIHTLTQLRHFGTKSASFPNDPTTHLDHPFCFIKVRIFSIYFIFEQLRTHVDAGASKMCAKNTHFDARAYFCAKVCLFGATKKTHFDALFAS